MIKLIDKTFNFPNTNSQLFKCFPQIFYPCAFLDDKVANPAYQY